MPLPPVSPFDYLVEPAALPPLALYDWALLTVPPGERDTAYPPVLAASLRDIGALVLGSHHYRAGVLHRRVLLLSLWIDLHISA